MRMICCLQIVSHAIVTDNDTFASNVFHPPATWVGPRKPSMGIGLQHCGHSFGSRCLSAWVRSHAVASARRGNHELQFSSRCDELVVVEECARAGA